MEPQPRQTESGKTFTRLHPDSKGAGSSKKEEDLMPINIEPTEGGAYGYPLVYPLDFELCFQGLFPFQTLVRLQEWQLSEQSLQTY